MSERTKRLIGETMKRLMETKSVEKIRVTELCRAAGIERPTFYYYFKDKYDLLAWIFAQGAENTDVLSVGSAAEALRGEGLKVDEAAVTETADGLAVRFLLRGEGVESYIDLLTEG